MDEHARGDVVLFGGFRFDRCRASLLRQNTDGTLTPVAIGSRALDILGLLIERHGDVVSREEILTIVWPGIVEGANVTVQISALRRVLDEGRSDGSLIQTIPRRGYRFVAPVTRCEAGPPPEAGGDENRAAAGLAQVPGPRRRRAASVAIAVAIGAMLLLSVTAWWLWPTVSPFHDRRPRLDPKPYGTIRERMFAELANAYSFYDFMHVEEFLN